MNFKNIGYIIGLSIITLTTAKLSSAQVRDPEVLQLENDIRQLQEALPGIINQGNQEFSAWLSNASCAELEGAYQSFTNDADYWSNVEASGTPVQQATPNTRASMALNSANAVSVEYSRRC